MATSWNNLDRYGFSMCAYDRRRSASNKCVLYWITLVAFALPGERSADSRDDNGLSIRVQSDSAEIVSGEPVRVVIALENRSDRSVQISRNIFDCLHVFYTREQWEGADVSAIILRSRSVHRHDGRLYVEYKGFQQQSCAAESIVLQPGDSIRNENVILIEFIGSIRIPIRPFSDPGSYQLKARLDTEQGVLESAPLRIIVSRVSEIDRKAQALFCGTVAASFVQGEFSKDGLDSLSKLLVHYSSSPYADHARFAIAEYLHAKLQKRPESAVDLDDVWALSVVRRWAATRAAEHYWAVSDQHKRLRLRARCRLGYLVWSLALPIENLHFESLERFFTENVGQTREMGCVGDGVEAVQLPELLRGVSILFREDERLDCLVQLGQLDNTTTGELFALAARQCNVSLNAPGHILNAKAPPMSGIMPLRQLLVKFSRSDAGDKFWEAHGDGYSLRQTDAVGW